MKTKALLGFALLLGDARHAEACGGCFAPVYTETSVEAHRMAVSLTTTETVLWDQIRYTGEPEDFVWVLPVPSSEAVVELASATFFDDLDAGTVPIVQPPGPPPFRTSVGCMAGSANAAPPSGDGVTVFRWDTVGPYETLVIGAEDPGALRAWLSDNGYQIPDATLPTIDWYVAQGSVFVILRLEPGLGVNAMQPVRVRYPGYMETFPLKMVSVGAGATLELSLWVFGDQRFEARNYATLPIDTRLLVWDWDTNTTNYDTVFDDAIDRAGGRAWIVEFVGFEGDLGWQPESANDLALAQAGREYQTTITRLRTRMLVDHLAEDLELRPAAVVDHFGPFLIAAREINRPDPDDEGACAVGLGRRASGMLAALVVGAAALLVIRRTRRR
jgi:hypothetical protein